MMTLLAAILLIIGGLLLIIATWGLIILPDALSRQHAATKAGTLALVTLCLGAMLMNPDFAWIWRLALIALFLLATLPVASQLLARAAVREGKLDDVLAHAEKIDSEHPGHQNQP